MKSPLSRAQRRWSLRLTVVVGVLILSSVAWGELAAASFAAPRPGAHSPYYGQEVSSLSNEEGLSQAQAEAVINAQDNAPDIVAALRQGLGSNYAGVWLDHSHAHFKFGQVNGADPGPAYAVAQQRGVVADAVSVKSTWADLESAQQQWITEAKSLLKPGEWQTSLDASRNAVEVDLSSSVDAATAATLKSQAAASSVAVRIVDKPQSSLAVPATEGACAWSACDPPIRGGQNIQGPMVPGWQSSCTGGFTVFSNSDNKPYMLTAGHCPWGDPYSSWWWAFNMAGQAPGIGPDWRYYLDSTEDAGIIQEANHYWWNGPLPPPPEVAVFGGNTTYYIYGTTSSYMNLYECHVGAASDVQCGNDNQINATPTVRYGPPINMTVTFNPVMTGNTACSTPGDSGGPWVSQYYATGIEIAGNGCPNPQSYYFWAANAAASMNTHFQVIN